MIAIDGKPLLADQTAVVTGAGQGMGKAIALGLASAGAKVVVSDVNREAIERVSEQIKKEGGTAWPIVWNVADPDGGAIVAEETKRLSGDASILINNAGIHRRARVGSTDHLKTWREIMSVNLDGPMLAVAAFLEQLKATRGCVVNLASIQSFAAAPNDTTAYATSKGGVAMFTKSLAVELAQHGIRVNAVAPGFMETPQTEGSRANPDRVAFVMSHTPMGRAGQAEEIVGPVVFLSSSMSSFVNGAVLPVDGGFLTL